MVLNRFGVVSLGGHPVLDHQFLLSQSLALGLNGFVKSDLVDGSNFSSQTISMCSGLEQFFNSDGTLSADSLVDLDARFFSIQPLSVIFGVSQTVSEAELMDGLATFIFSYFSVSFQNLLSEFISLSLSLFLSECLLFKDRALTLCGCGLFNSGRLFGVSSSLLSGIGSLFSLLSHIRSLLSVSSRILLSGRGFRFHAFLRVCVSVLFVSVSFPVFLATFHLDIGLTGFAATESFREIRVSFPIAVP